MIFKNEEEALNIYKLLWQVRFFETRASELYKDGELPGFIHLSLGQEACAVGACSALNKNDFITSTHRGHGHCLAKGAEPSKMMAELFGKVTGYSKGRGGSMHIADIEIGVLGANGIVGQSAPLAVGAALKSQVTNSKQVSLAFFGEGASGAGVVHEAMNIAGLWKLPVIFFCEVNKYAELSPYETHVPIKDISLRAQSYGFSGTTIDGNNLLSVYETVKKAAKKARDGLGPSLIEAKTNRWHGHYEGDPQKYKPSEELDNSNWIDPITLYETYLKEDLKIDDKRFLQIKDFAKNNIENAIKFAQSSETLSANDIYQDVYSMETS